MLVSKVVQKFQEAVIPTRIGKAMALSKEHNLSVRNISEIAELFCSGDTHIGFAMQQMIRQKPLRGVARLDQVP